MEAFRKSRSRGCLAYVSLLLSRLLSLEIVPEATHFFEGQEEALLKAVAGFLDGAFAKK
jgi:alpha/beta superfamily hydrolase